jgi:prophage regulatory protein
MQATRQLWALPSLMAAIGFKPSAIYEQVAAGLLPQPIKYGLRTKRYLSDEIQAVVDARAAGADEDEIRALVKRLHAARTKGASASVSA